MKDNWGRHLLRSQLLISLLLFPSLVFLLTIFFSIKKLYMVITENLGNKELWLFIFLGDIYIFESKGWVLTTQSSLYLQHLAHGSHSQCLWDKKINESYCGDDLLLTSNNHVLVSCRRLSKKKGKLSHQRTMKDSFCYFRKLILKKK